ncbi:hypothetical protein KFL_003750150 [Klebsormidium nitens]|uniref:Uncharacterized protein n=1 Tax=Klebsormidium nitens TaxID=105231 RepID=A0A1Y1I9X5_KLENI|nr:hypothetical protein KFL_003750150 [Klebsormidium nitens]|eukprot:GAQ87765.1 hypothetical protein KFL_003750150 [Klebsormidium nitens]
MDHLRQYNNDAAVLNHNVHMATHPGDAARYKMRSKNPLNRWRWQFNNRKHAMQHPVQHQQNKAKWRMNRMNPLYYMKSIKRNLVSAFTCGRHA